MAVNEYNYTTVPDNFKHRHDQREQDFSPDSPNNQVLIIAGKIGIEAVEDKIVILTDKFRSGYECPLCDETGENKRCECELARHPGTNRLGGTCNICSGNPENLHGKKCPKCKGIGSTLVIPESTKSMPTSGVIVSVGPNCKARKLGERVLYGGHTGYNLPFKGNVRLRIMRESEPLCLMHAIDNSVTMEDFQILEEPIDNVSGLSR